MRRHGAIFGFLIAVLIALLWLLMAEPSPAKHDRQASEKNGVTQERVMQILQNKSLNTEPTVVPKFSPLPRAYAPKSESESSAGEGMNRPEEKPQKRVPVPKYEIPQGPKIIPFVYQQVHFKGSPENVRMGLGLYLTISDESHRRLAFAQRQYLTRLTTFLASHYRYEVVQTAAGKRKFLDALLERFQRRVKGDVIQAIDFGFFDTIELDDP